MRLQQSRCNQSTASHWDHFEFHRRQVHALLGIGETDLARGDGKAAAGGRLAVLGAGNCNDLDLPSLLERFEEVHLVDIDPAAIEAAVARQGVAGNAGVRLHGGVDLTGVADVLAGWPGRTVLATEIDACIARMHTAAVPALAGPSPNAGFDCVLSPCILSQICGLAEDTISRVHPRCRDVRAAIRGRHLRLMAHLLRPGGSGVIVCDVTHSGMVPDLLSARRDDLSGLLRTHVAAGRSFGGLDPDSLDRAIRSDPLVAPLIGQIQRTAPWLWKLGPKQDKTFLVHALRFRRIDGPVLIG